MRRQHRALPWISRKLVGVCCAALHGLRELARVAPQNGTAVFYDWCAFSEVRRRGNRDTICCAAIGCHDVLNGFAWRVFNHICDNVLVRTPESRRRVGRVW